MRRLLASQVWPFRRHKHRDHEPRDQQEATSSDGQHNHRNHETRDQQNGTLGNGRLPLEILQEVFAYLDMWTLLLECRRVCRLWQHSIPGDSHALRSSLFLSQHNFKPDDLCTGQSIHFNAALYGPFLNTTEGQRATGYTLRLRKFADTDRRHNYLSKATLNPLLQLDTTRTKLKRYKASWNRPVDARPLWTKMLACEPPVEKLAVRITFENTDVPTEECMVTPHNTSWTMENPKGVTLGEVYSAIHNAMWWPLMSMSLQHLGVLVLPSVNGDLWDCDGAASDYEEGFQPLVPNVY